MKETITVQLSEDLKKKSKLKASCTDRDISEVVRNSLESWTKDVDVKRGSNGEIKGIEIEVE